MQNVDDLEDYMRSLNGQLELQFAGPTRQVSAKRRVEAHKITLVCS